MGSTKHKELCKPSKLNVCNMYDMGGPDPQCNPKKEGRLENNSLCGLLEDFHP